VLEKFVNRKILTKLNHW